MDIITIINNINNTNVAINVEDITTTAFVPEAEDGNYHFDIGYTDTNTSEYKNYSISGPSIPKDVIKKIGEKFIEMMYTKEYDLAEFTIDKTSVKCEVFNYKLQSDSDD